MSTAGRSLARIMRTCSAFGGFVKSSSASAVAGASSGSMTTGADTGLAEAGAHLEIAFGCLAAGLGSPGSWPKRWAGSAWHWANPTQMGRSTDAALMGGGVRMRETATGFWRLDVRPLEAHLFASTSSSNYSRPPPRQIHSALQKIRIRRLPS